MNFFEELKRRNVFRVGVAYLALTWVWFEDPIIRRLAGEPAFVALKAGVDEHIDAERAKLGWPPAGESE